MDYQQCFVAGVSSGGAPIEAPSDHCFVIDHGELVVQLVATGKAGGADAFEGWIQWLITRFYLAGVIWKADPQQIEHLREGAARKPWIGDQPDLHALFDLLPQHVGELLR